MATHHLAKNWWITLIRGIVAILFGLLAIFKTGATLDLLIFFLVIYLLLDGLIAIISAAKAAIEHHKWWLFFLEGLVNVGAAMVIYLWPDISVFALVYLVAFWAIISGIFLFWAGVTAPWSSEKRWPVGIAGIISFIIGVIMISLPLATLITFIWIIGIYALLFGVALVVYSITLRHN